MPRLSSPLSGRVRHQCASCSEAAVIMALADELADRLTLHPSFINVFSESRLGLEKGLCLGKKEYMLWKIPR